MATYNKEFVESISTLSFLNGELSDELQILKGLDNIKRPELVSKVVARISDIHEQMKEIELKLN